MKRLLIVSLCLGSLLPIGCQSSTSHKPADIPLVRVEWPLGTVLVSKNNDESLNKSPGDQNHLAIYIGGGKIVESQKDQGGVILTSFSTYKARDYTWFPMFPLNEATGVKAAAKAKTLVGLPYSDISSLLRVDRNEAAGLNCVSVVRVSYSYALGHPLPQLHVPDDILQMTDVFTRNWSGYRVLVPATPEPPRKAALQGGSNGTDQIPRSERGLRRYAA